MMSRVKKIFFVFAAVFLAAPALATEPFGGVGVLLDQDPQNPQGVIITSVTYKSPADKAKVRRGDRLLKIDGADVAGMSGQQLAEKIRGPVGSTVTLTVSGGAGVRDVPLIRAPMTNRPIISIPAGGTYTGPSAGTGTTTTTPAAAANTLSPEEKELVKKKIMGLTTDEQREKMMNILQAFKEGKVDKPSFLKFMKSDF